ncbi:hypothetical protein ACP4OV_005817 [Aristida adscensionis]
MAGGFGPVDGSARDYGEGVTISVAVTCLMAASCGIIFGYDSGVTGATLSSLVVHCSSLVLSSMLQP